MKVSYRREMRHNYLILEAMEENLESFEIRMLAGNVIDGLLRFRLKQEDQGKYYYYEITSKQPLSRMLEFREIRGEELRQLIFGIGEALSWVENYLLQESRILLEPEYIYIEPESFRVWLCYVPGYSGDFPAAVERLLHYLLRRADHQDNDTVVMAYRLYQESQKDYFGIEDLLRIAREKREELLPQQKDGEPVTGGIREEQDEAEAERGERAKPPEGGRDVPESWTEREKESKQKGKILLLPAVLLFSQAVIWLFRGKEGILQYGLLTAAAEMAAALLAVLFVQGAALYRRRTGRKERRRPDDEPDDWRMAFSQEEGERDGERKDGDEKPSSPDDGYGGLTENLRPGAAENAGGNTVLLSEMKENQGGAHLLKSLDPSVADIPVPYFPFLIGKQEGIVDYVLAKDTVSRIHLRIDQKDNGVQITDLNSSNGTRVGEHLLNANESCSLSSGEKVMIADLTFVFY